MNNRLKKFDNPIPLCGRTEELKGLEKRILTAGITILGAPPQTGKTRLIQELILRVDKNQQYCWGYAQGFNDSIGEIILRAIDDLYKNWTQQRSWAEEAKQRLDELRKKDVKDLGRLTLAIIKNFDVPGTKLVSSALQSLTNLKEGVGQLARPLDYAQVHEVCELISHLSGKSILIVLDAFEQSDKQNIPSSILLQYLQEISQWPQVHFIVALRSPAESIKSNEKSALDEAGKWRKASPKCQYIELEDIAIKTDIENKTRLAQFLIEKVPFLTVDNIEEYLEKSAGFPGIWNRWFQGECDSQAALLTQIEEAQEARYSELESKFNQLDKDSLKVALRLALFPELVDESGLLLEPIYLGEQGPETLDCLKRAGVIELNRELPPKFGLTQRYEYARKWAIQNYSRQCVTIIEQCLPDLIGYATLLDAPDKGTSAVGVLLSWQELSEFLPFKKGMIEFCLLSGTFLGVKIKLSVLELAKQYIQSNPSEVYRKLYSIALCNSLNDFKEENKLERRDLMLTQLEQLYTKWPEDKAVRVRWAKGLFNSLIDFKEENKLERRDLMLTQLEQLSQEWPEDKAVRQRWAMGLFNSVNDFKEENKLERRDLTLTQLEQLSQEWPEDKAVREWWAKGLFNSLNHFKEEKNTTKIELQMEKLNKLISLYPSDKVVKEINKQLKLVE